MREHERLGRRFIGDDHPHDAESEAGVRPPPVAVGGVDGHDVADDEAVEVRVDAGDAPPGLVAEDVGGVREDGPALSRGGQAAVGGGDPGVRGGIEGDGRHGRIRDPRSRSRESRHAQVELNRRGSRERLGRLRDRRGCGGRDARRSCELRQHGYGLAGDDGGIEGWRVLAAAEGDGGEHGREREPPRQLPESAHGLRLARGGRVAIE